MGVTAHCLAALAAVAASAASAAGGSAAPLVGSSADNLTDVCGVVTTAHGALLAALSNTTGAVVSSVDLGAAHEWSSPLVGGTDPAGRTYLAPNASGVSLWTATLARGGAEAAHSVTVTPPPGYAGAFRITHLALDSAAGWAPVGLLVSGSWAVLARINASTGASAAISNVTQPYWGAGYDIVPGLGALDGASRTLWLVAPGGDGDVAVGVDVAGAAAPPAPTVVPLPQGSVVGALAFAGPFFSGPGLLATVTNPAGGGSPATVSLLGSFVNQAGGADFFEVADYDPGVAAPRPPGAHVATSPSDHTAWVGLVDHAGGAFVSVVNTASNEEVGRVTPRGCALVALAPCAGPSGG